MDWIKALALLGLGIAAGIAVGAFADRWMVWDRLDEYCDRCDPQLAGA